MGFARENVLGTNRPFPVTAPDEAPALRADAAVRAGVERLAAVLSTWDDKARGARRRRVRGDAQVRRLFAGAGRHQPSATGLWLFPYLKKRRRSDLWLAMVGTIVLVAAFAFGVA